MFYQCARTLSRTASIGCQTRKSSRRCRESGISRACHERASLLTEAKHPHLRSDGHDVECALAHPAQACGEPGRARQAPPGAAGGLGSRRHPVRRPDAPAVLGQCLPRDDESVSSTRSASERGTGADSPAKLSPRFVTEPHVSCATESASYDASTRLTVVSRVCSATKDAVVPLRRPI